ncbi:MAG: hypothetical protein V1925_04945 [Candidatus Omnitrophota bacterium]
MENIRDLFHKVGNCHNKITVGTGVARMELTEGAKSNQLPPKIKKALERLTELEKHALEASKVLNQLRDAVYSIIDPDTQKPKAR